MLSDDVLAFLDSHPDFIQHHAKRLGVKILEQEGQSIISLSERQILGLTEKVRQLENKLMELIHHGETNCQIQGRLHQLSVSLLKAESIAALVNIVQTRLAADFGLERVALRLWHPAAQNDSHFLVPTPAIQTIAQRLTFPSCGPYVNDEIMSWFPTIPVLQSFSLMALHNDAQRAFGLLVLGSDDPKRFTYDMHTYYLTQMSQLLAAALLRVLGSTV